MFRFRSAAASAFLGGALSAVAFGAQSGTDLASSTAVSIAVTLSAGILLALVILWGRDSPLYGGASVLLLAALTAVTALSATWSIAPHETAAETARVFSYLLAFAAAVAAARQAPHAAPVVATAIGLAGVVVCGWALATRVWPDSLGEDLLLTSRLGAPFDYWNALGGMAALSTPAVLWMAARREGSNALAYPAMGILMLAMLLTQSRGALAAALVSLLLWFVLVPLRLRSVPAVLLPALAVAPVAAWALSRDQFTEAFQSVGAQSSVAGTFGLLVLAQCTVLLVAGVLIRLLSSRATPSMRLRRRAGVVLVAFACALPLAALASTVVSDRGLGGNVSDRLEELTSETEAPPSSGGRLASASSSRGEYWRQAGEIFEARPGLGTGANTFGLARIPYRDSGRSAAHAHGFIPQTMADLGLLGLFTALALLVAWAIAAGRTLGLGASRRQPDQAEDHVALVAIAVVVIAFGLHSAIDWIWAVPGTAIAALVAAGFVAGRGPADGTVITPAAPPPGRRSGVHAGRIMAAAGMLIAAGLLSWAIWQPQAAARANERALDAVARGDFRAAEEIANEARELDPYNPEPLFTLASARVGQGRLVAGYRALEQAVREHPRDPDTWIRLADFELRRLDLPLRALGTVEAVRKLDPNSARVKLLLAQVQAALAPGAPPVSP